MPYTVATVNLKVLLGLLPGDLIEQAKIFGDLFLTVVDRLLL